MEKYLREWRQDAINKHQYDTAIFVADKLLHFTKDDQDAFWLAQAHFSTGNYSRTQALLARGNLAERNPQCRYLSAHCSIKLGRIEEALQILGDKNPTHLISAPGSARQKLRHVDVNSRVGARHNKAGGRTERHPTSEERDREDVNNIKSEAGMCYLRGVCYARQNSFDRAKECYKTAVQIDVQCYEAFQALMTNSLMSPDEEWKFLESLDFDTINVSNNPSLSQEAAHFTKILYITRLSKYSKPEEFANATETLSTHYNLGNNADILLAKADLMYTHCRFREALALTSSVLDTDKYNFNILPVHLASLHELRETSTLYLLAHDLADTNPTEPCSWLAVGVYYLATNRIAEARRYFSKASMMDPHFGPAWIGFAHTFAAEGEHDQAISAYSTAARLFQGTHLPQLFLGMQNLQLNNLSLAREYLKTAYALCQSDPLLLNEMGVVFFHEAQLLEAISMFRRALTFSESNKAEPETLLPMRLNLAHSLRRAGQLDEALATFEEVLRHGVKDPGVFSAKGLVLLELGRSWDAVTVLHEALAVAPQDPLATDLLNKALEANETDSGVDMGGQSWTAGRIIGDADEHGHALLHAGNEDDEFDDLDRKMNGRLREIEQNRVAGRRGARRRRIGDGRPDDSGMLGEGDSMMLDERA
ncbi:anaphase-promoting complex subunit Cut9 [Dothidotthia symphoricarpi CBS 119687]|uniref:Anaphase-promoting complex subunit Cut9 n=1 Tax=Dothidotthia symphoricarpi CBS 119687 TaxID=1392245 RepID=A0A6A5ZZX3_9PLEO|nr:anaphase-promoting complex subunit Cut9 [Dothidotthia symphoricarpi CBS 119687]KAF2125302.1 anaphase-promoting complex subunit Cut9 [Dothidotthia symphoricarpi CBS 119687]